MVKLYRKVGCVLPMNVAFLALHVEFRWNDQEDAPRFNYLEPKYRNFFIIDSIKPDIMADTAYGILCKDTNFSGNFIIDHEFLMDNMGLNSNDINSYQVDPSTPIDDLMIDFFLPERYDRKWCFEQNSWIKNNRVWILTLTIRSL